MLGLAASALSILWVPLAFGSLPLVGIDEPLRSILLIVIDLTVFVLGVFGIVRARLGRESYLLAIVLICAPAAHWIGSVVGGEIIILFIAVPALVVVAVAALEGVRKLYARRRQTL